VAALAREEKPDYPEDSMPFMPTDEGDK
jgi:hypothetical protein